MPTSHFLQFVGGLTFFFFGLFSIHQGLQFFAGDRLKNMIARTTAGRFRSLLTGIIVTFFFQSSSAVTLMTVGLTSSGLLTLEQTMAVGLGAGIGTTFVVLLISIKSILQAGIPFIALGLAIRWMASRQMLKVVGEILFGFGFVFLGMLTMSQAAAPLQSSPYIPQILDFMENYPFANFVIAALVTGLVHSSGVVLGILISLAYAGAISFPVAVPLVLGANVGTSVTALLAAFNSTSEGKRAAWSHLLLRFAAVLLLYPFLNLFTQLIQGIDGYIFTSWLHLPVTVHGEIASCHFFFNVFVALVFLPFITPGKKLICWLIPSTGEVEVFGPKYLDKNALSTPSLAFAQASRELVRMGEIVQKMFRDCLVLFNKYDFDRVSVIEASDHQVDTLYRAIKFYLARLSLETLKEEEADTELYLITAVNELESIGDAIDRHLLRLAHKKWNKGVEFSEEGAKEIRELHASTCEMLDMTLAALASGSEEVAYKMQHHQIYYHDREDELKMSHLMRLHQGRKESIGTSALHLELLAIFHQINSSLLTIVSHLLPEREVKELADQ